VIFVGNGPHAWKNYGSRISLRRSISRARGPIGSNRLKAGPVCTKQLNNNAILFTEAPGYGMKFRETIEKTLPYIYKIIQTAPLSNINIFHWFPALCWHLLHSKQANPSLFLVNSLLVSFLVAVWHLFDILHLICCTSWVFSFCVCVSFYFIAINIIFWLPFSLLFSRVDWRVNLAVISPTLVVFLLNHAFFHISRKIQLIDWSVAKSQTLSLNHKVFQTPS